MNWNLITKDNKGELQVSFFWFSLLIVFIGFLFGFGVFLANLTVNTVFGNDGYYAYFFIKEYFVFILLGIILLFVNALK